MSYCTTLDLLTRFGAESIAQRADDKAPRLVTGELLTTAAEDGDLSGESTETIARVTAAMMVIDKAIADADATINSHVSARYRLPMSPVPAVLERIACDLARYYLWGDAVTEAIQTRHDDGVKVLVKVANGTQQLGADALSGDQPNSSAGAEIVTGGRVWSRDRSRGVL